MLVAEEVLDDLGEGPVARQEAAHQLIYDVLVEPAEYLNLPSSLVERNVFEDQQMTAMELERPIVRQCRRVATLWFRWVNAQGLVYPRGVEGTWTRIWELVTTMPRIEIAHPHYLAQLLAPAPLPPPGGLLCPLPLATTGFSSESSNSINGPARRESDE